MEKPKITRAEFKTAKGKLNKPAASKKKVEPKVLKPGQMTQKKLDSMRNKLGRVSFLLAYPFDSILVAGTSSREDVVSMVVHDAEAAICPDDTYVLKYTTIRVYKCDPAKNTLTVIVNTDVIHTISTKVAGASMPEDVAKAPLHNLDGKVLAVAPATPGIHATIYTKGWHLDFDATMWFDVAVDFELLDLVRQGWVSKDGIGMSINIAELCRVHWEPVRTFIATHSKPDVQVDAVSAMKWIAQHRPHLLDHIDVIEGVTKK